MFNDNRTHIITFATKAMKSTFSNLGKKINILFYGRIVCLFIVAAITNLFPAAVLPPSQKIESFEKSWRFVDSLMKTGLTASALDSVDCIYKTAKESDNVAQIVKSIMYQMKLWDIKEENAFVKSLNRLEAEIKDAKFPAAAMLHSMLAECLWGYYQNNRRF
jgi:hypothetical protein